MPTDANDIAAGVEAAYAQAYSDADPGQLGELFTPDATVQTEWGPVLDGRAEIEPGLIALFGASQVPDALINVPVLSRQISPDVIVSHGTASRNAPDGPTEHFLYTRVYVHRDGHWLIAANHIARPSEHPKPDGVGANPDDPDA